MGEQENNILWWRAGVYVENAVLAVWPATVVTECDTEIFVEFFKNEFNVDITIIGMVETLPDDHDDGGRQDMFFLRAYNWRRKF